MANPCSEGSLEGSLAGRTGTFGRQSLALALLAFLRCSAVAVPVGLARRKAFVNRGAPFRCVLSVLLPGVRIDAERSQGYFRVSLKRFFWPPWQHFRCYIHTYVRTYMHTYIHTYIQRPTYPHCRLLKEKTHVRV